MRKSTTYFYLLGSTLKYIFSLLTTEQATQPIHCRSLYPQADYYGTHTHSKYKLICLTNHPCFVFLSKSGIQSFPANARFAAPVGYLQLLCMPPNAGRCRLLSTTKITFCGGRFVLLSFYLKLSIRQATKSSIFLLLSTVQIKRNITTSSSHNAKPNAICCLSFNRHLISVIVPLTFFVCCDGNL